MMSRCKVPRVEIIDSQRRQRDAEVRSQRGREPPRDADVAWSEAAGSEPAEGEGELALPVERLEWSVPLPEGACRAASCHVTEPLPVGVRRSVRVAAEELGENIECLDLTRLAHVAWGARSLKEWGASPDGAVQQALQLAYRLEHGRTVNTYEACR